ncbi:universal stress protein [Pelagerythrobacter sp.]|uniref:universal stress protein n=1 Tax=Pelagerythrobacter sp. TaxID=2800702 RepID=UPI0035AEDB0C
MFENILAPVKLTAPDEARKAVEVAGKLARDCDAWLTLATIAPHWVVVKDADYSWEARRWFEARAAAGLERLKAHIRPTRCRTLSRWGSVPGSILHIAEEIRADVIVLPAREPALVDLLYQPEPIRIAAKASCSVVLVR